MPQDASPPPAQSLRVLCLDGGGIKGYTTLLILRRIFRTIAAEGQLAGPPRPCDVFDIIAGTSTGGLIAVMLGRLRMTIDECIVMYEQLGKEVFGKRQVGGQFGKFIKGLASSSFYDIEVLQEQVRRVMRMKAIHPDEAFLELEEQHCKVMVCATRVATSKADVLRSYESMHPTAENYDCKVWEAASATAAAPMFFKSVKFGATGERWCDGGLRRNNPINEVLAELSREAAWEGKQIGCVLSLGTGLARVRAVSTGLASFLRGSLKIMTDAEDTAKAFAASAGGTELSRSHRYFRFNVPQGMEDLQLDEWKETERMKALTTEYLSHPTTGEMVQRCAKSLLYPDENLQVVLKPKLSILPYHPCTHFIGRPVYTERLRKFFSPHMEYRQIFALWGLGGVGKTQIALDFAQSIKHRLSVFWIRADNITNFITDYSQILKVMGGEDQASVDPATSAMTLLEKTRRKLEDHSGDWLLILDNADHLDQFLGTDGALDGRSVSGISTYIPRRGRILITTRDRRFQGSVAPASDGMCVELMTENEAEELLLKSVPNHLIKQSSINHLMAKELVEELGYLPLAVAQAAANIVDQQLSFAEYVRLFREKKRRFDLMQAPAYDFANGDPRNSMQSVAVTWQISLDVLRAQSPMSLVFLRYLACFHWRDIPQMVLKMMPDFQELDLAQFTQMVKRPLALSLIEEVQQDDGTFVMYSIHPLLHEIMIRDLSSEEREVFLAPLVGIMSSLFPVVPQRTQETWPLAEFLAPHVTRQVELCQAVSSSSQPLAMLMFSLSKFYQILSRRSFSADLAVASLAMGIVHFGTDHEAIFYIRQHSISLLNDAARYKEAIVEANVALESLDSEALLSSFGEKRASMERHDILNMLAESLRGCDRFKEIEVLHRGQLKNEHIELNSTRGVVARHNLAHALVKNGAPTEAQAINDELLAFCETEQGKVVVGPRLHMIMLNLKSLIIRDYGVFEDQKEELLQLHERVLRETMSNHGIQDIDTWKALNNMLGVLGQCNRVSDTGPLLQHYISIAVSEKIKAEGKFENVFQQVFGTAVEYLDYLSEAEGPEAALTVQFKDLLQTWKYIAGIDEDENYSTRLKLTRFNNHGVHLQRRGLYEESEQVHRKVIEMRHQFGLLDGIKVDYYNLMLALGSCGRLEEAMELRDQHRDLISQAEAVHCTFEEKMTRRAEDAKTYQQAKQMIQDGSLRRGDQWWLDRAEILQRAEFRFGILKESSHGLESALNQDGTKGCVDHTTNSPKGTGRTRKDTFDLLGLNPF